MNTEWNTEDFLLINWFLNELNLPIAPFKLDERGFFSEFYCPSEPLEIKDEKKFYKIIKADIGIGPTSYMASSGILQLRLKLLKRLVENRENSIL